MSVHNHAMRCCPKARRQEFEQAVDAARLGAHMRVAEVPAGGGHLKAYLPAGCELLAHDSFAGFAHHGVRSDTPPFCLHLPWPDETIDVAISVAGMRRLRDKQPLLAELHRVVRSRGRLVVSDVAQGSAAASFLDRYVSRHNRAGAERHCLGRGTLREFETAGWRVEHHRLTRFHWVFSSREVMAEFCHQYFELQSATVADTLAAIEAGPGVEDLPDGTVGMNWTFRTIVACRS